MIRTARLELIPADAAMIESALAGREELSRSLGASIPETWPPEFLDEASYRYTLERLTEGPAPAGWWLHFIVHPDPEGRTLIGSAGYKGPPDTDGTVEIGYAIVRDRRLRGFATEAALGLVNRAFADRRTSRVIAETLPELVGSIAVLDRCGFGLYGEGSEPGSLRYELTRETHEILSRTR